MLSWRTCLGGPIDNAVDWHMGEARLDAMLKCVKARIQKMINKN